MRMYDTPIEGLYDYKTPRYDKTFDVRQVGVWVLGESATKYMIRMRLPVGFLPQGHEMSVFKRNVKVHRPAPEPIEYDYTDAYWQK